MALQEAGVRHATGYSPFADIGAFAKSLEQFTQFQSQLIEEMQEVNHHWLDRIQSENALASELSSKLAAARSIPETATLYQEWIRRQFEIAAEDSQYVMKVGARLWSKSWPAAPTAEST